MLISKSFCLNYFFRTRTFVGEPIYFNKDKSLDELVDQVKHQKELLFLLIT